MSVLSIVVAIILLAVNAGAAGLGVSIELADVQPRLNAPILIPATVQWDGAGLMEGRLEATLFRRDLPVGVTYSPPMFLSPGKRRTILTLPPPPGLVNGDSLDVFVRFAGKGMSTDSGVQPLGSIQLGDAKELVLCVARVDSVNRTPREFALARERSLWLESALPKLPFNWPGHVTTRQTALNTDDFPVNPAGYCAFDGVLLDGPAFARLSEKQLTALARWVRAGGNLAITPGDAGTPPLAERHLSFFRRLAAGTNYTAILNDVGRLVPQSGSAFVGTARLAPELGRFVVVAEPESGYDLDGPVWRNSVAWMWKANEKMLRDIAAFDADEAFVTRLRGSLPDDRSAWILQAAAGFLPMAPDAPRQIPFGVLGCILGGLLLVVAPGEWFVLGRLRKRRLTWIIFPLSCAGCAWFVSNLASRYVGFQDRAGSLRIVDIGEDGRIIRDVRFHQILPSTDRVWTHDVRDGLAAVVVRKSGEELDETTPERAYEEAPAESEWISQERFVLRRSLRQWTPALVRVTTFPDLEDDSGLDWTAAHAAGESVARDSIGVVKAYGNWTVALSDNLSLWNGTDQLDAFGSEQMPASDFSEMRSIGTTIARAAGVSHYALISRYSPALGGHYSDLATYSPREHSCLAAWRRSGTELVIYRRHFRKPAVTFQEYRDQ